MSRELSRERHQDRQDSADTFTTDAQTLSRADSSRGHANRLMDDLELLRIERQVSNEERLENASKAAGRRSTSHNRHDRHHPQGEPEDAFHTLTEPVPLPAAAEPKAPPTFLTKTWKKLRKFPRVVRYLTYVSLISFSPCSYFTPCLGLLPSSCSACSIYSFFTETPSQNLPNFAHIGQAAQSPEPTQLTVNRRFP